MVQLTKEVVTLMGIAVAVAGAAAAILSGGAIDRALESVGGGPVTVTPEIYAGANGTLAASVTIRNDGRSPVQVVFAALDGLSGEEVIHAGSGLAQYVPRFYDAAADAHAEAPGGPWHKTGIAHVDSGNHADWQSSWPQQGGGLPANVRDYSADTDQPLSVHMEPSNREYVAAGGTGRVGTAILGDNGDVMRGDSVILTVVYGVQGECIGGTCFYGEDLRRATEIVRIR